MLKNREIIEKLTIEQKLSIIASLRNLNNPNLAKAGVPGFSLSDMGSINAGMKYILPPLSGVANSWNVQLMRDLGLTLSQFANADNVDMVLTSDIRMKDTPYQCGFTEEPYLSERYVAALSSAMKKGGVTPCLSECGLNALNVRYADKDPNVRPIYEYYLRPFYAAAKESGCAVALSCESLSGSYANINSRVINSCLKTVLPDGVVLYVNADAETQIKALAGGNLLLDGDVSVVKAAYESYRKLKEKVRRGECEVAELEKAIASYKALDESKIDGAVDRAIDFALSCRTTRTGAPKVERDYGSVALKASEESIVLLKNKDDVLPLKKGAKIAVIGNVPTAFGGLTAEAFAKAAKASGLLTVKGVCDGYAVNSERSDELIEKALKAVNGADYAVLFLGGTGSEKGASSERRLALPANRVALIANLIRTGVKIIAVMDSGIQIDTCFDDGVNALLVSPMDGAYCARALVSVITGGACPSGRLASTYYDHVDERFAAVYENKNDGKLKVGSFLGYRYYDAAEEKIRYPFGYGLSYTQFAYSDVEVEGNTVKVSVKNIGERSGSEVVQVYIGKSDSLILRPKKVLAAFAKVALDAGQSKRITLNIDPAAVSAKTNLGFVAEGGEYEVYVGASALDIKLTAKMNIAGKKFRQATEKLSEYILPQSNVLTEGYMFNDVQPITRKGSKVKNVGLITSGVSAIVTAAYLLLVRFNILIITSPVLGWGLLGAFLAVFAAGLITTLSGLGISRREKRNTPIIKAIVPQEKKSERQSLELLFEELFDSKSQEQDKADKPAEGEDNSDTPVTIVKNTTTWSAVCGKLQVYLTKRGIAMDRRNVSKLLAAFASSRLVLVSGRNADKTTRAIKLLGDFFGGGYYQDKYADYQRVEDMFALASSGEETQAAKALEEAQRRKNSIVISALYGVEACDIGKFFMPLARCVNSPDTVNEVLLQQGGGAQKTLKISPNVWFVLVLKEGAKPNEVDPLICKLAAYIDVDVKEGKAVVGEGASEEALNFGQFNALAVASLDDYCLNEDYSWKKIDKIIKYITDNGGLKTDNRGWRRMERFSSAYLGCISRDEASDKGRERLLDKDALDNTVASELLLTAMGVAKRTKGGEREMLSLFDSVFNEEDVPECKKIISMCGLVTSD